MMERLSVVTDSTEAPVVRGWCPDFFSPMKAADGWLVRVRAPLRGFDAAGLQAVASLARTYGNQHGQYGAVELTNRGNIQVRGLAAGRLDAACADAVSAGLIEADPARERRRIVTMSPLADLDPTCNPQTSALAGRLLASVQDAVSLVGLHPKTAVVVDGGGILPPGSLTAGITVRTAGDAWCLVCGGRVTTGLTEAEVRHFVLRLLWYARSEAVGPETALSHLPLSGREKGWLSHALDSLCSAFPEPDWTTDQPRAGTRPPGLIGTVVDGWSGVGVRLGRLTVGTLEKLAEAMARQAGPRCASGYGESGYEETEATGLQEGRVRLTPFRSLLVPQEILDIVLDVSPECPDLIVSARDPSLRVRACIGAVGCAQSAGMTHDLALALAPMVPAGRLLHVAGCEKGCAHPRAADVTFVAQKNGYKAVRNGSAKEDGDRLGKDCGVLRDFLAKAF